MIAAIRQMGRKWFLMVPGMSGVKRQAASLTSITLKHLELMEGRVAGEESKRRSSSFRRWPVVIWVQVK